MMNVEKLIAEVQKFPVLYDQLSEKYRNPEYKEKIWTTIATELKVEGGGEECKRKWSSVRDQLRRTLLKRKRKSGQPDFKYRKYKYEDVLSFLVPYLGEEVLSNLPKPQDNEAVDKHESNYHNQEDFTQEMYQQWLVDVKPTIKDENIPPTSGGDSFRSSTPSSSQCSGNQNKFVGPKATKRKMPHPEETPQDSTSGQLILELRKKLKETVSQQHAVDAFLGGIAPSLKSLNPHLLNEAKGKIFAVVQEMELRQLQMNERSQGHFSVSNYMKFSSPSPESSPSTGDETRISNDPLSYHFENL